MVRVEDRDQSQQKLQVLIKSETLLRYTMTIAANETTFPPQNGYLISEIRAETIDICRKLERANICRMPADYDKRHELQIDALSICQQLKIDIHLAKAVYHFRESRAIYWASLVDEIIVLIRAWLKSDSKRVKSA